MYYYYYCTVGTSWNSIDIVVVMSVCQYFMRQSIDIVMTMPLLHMKIVWYGNGNVSTSRDNLLIW